MNEKGPITQTEISSIWLSDEQSESMHQVGTVLKGNESRRLKIMRTEDGRHFCELQKNPQKQAFVATLLKGIVPACDVKMVKTPEGPKYYSHKAFRTINWRGIELSLKSNGQHLVSLAQ